MSKTNASRPIVLSIAGFDPSGGAGIIADVQTIESFGCTAVAAITSITFQNSQSFHGALHQTAEAVRSQVLAIIEKQEVAAVKIGMLSTVEIMREVVRLVRELNLPAPIVDPVMRSTSGGRLMDEDAIEVLVSELLPLARLVTPNIPEAEHLSGLEIANEEQMREAAAIIRAMGARAVLVKGGHLKDQRSEVRGHLSGAPRREAMDLLDDGGQVSILRCEWIDAPNVRGTGCMLSSAIAAGLAQKKSLGESVHRARDFVADQIREAQNRLSAAKVIR